MLTGPVKIFTARNVPRLDYVADLILNDILGLSWKIITDKRRLGKGPVINYSGQSIPGSFRIVPAGLLFEMGVRPQEIIVEQWKGLPVFFTVHDDSDLPFDIFSAAFYLVTRYEEYLEFERDESGRFRASLSAAFKHGFLGIPLINLWSGEFARVLLKKFQHLSFKRNEFKALLTIDIDEAFAYRGKNIIRNLGDIIDEIKCGQVKIGRRLGFITGRKKDPYEIYDYLNEKIKANNTEALFFLPVGNRSPYDKNPSWKNDSYKKLISSISSLFRVGLHPSFRAACEPGAVTAEAGRLKSILNREVTASRFHYLRIILPESYRNLLLAGITEDYSMGYHDEPGFRAGIAGPFMFYDVENDIRTNLRVFPFQVMDVTLTGYKKINPAAAKQIILNLIEETRKAGGLFISIWHNTGLLDNETCTEWRDVFDFTLKRQKVSEEDSFSGTPAGS